MFEYYRKSKKILGMNSRNLEYIRPFNLKESRKIADDKLLSKRVLKKNDLPVPELLTKIRNHEELENFDWQSLPGSFALKPNRGFGGEGIIVVYGKKKNRDDAWIKADGNIVTISDLKTHIVNILDGSYSLAGTPDIAFFEERLKLLKLFKPYTYKGIPDIRIIVFNKVPVMAMMRIPTKDSQGKANLQQGAIGVGIDLASGITTSAVLGKNRIIDYVPGTRLLLSGIKIPHWKEILEMAVKAQEISGLGFLGSDIAIDKERGPIIVELNARPGLSIQIANLAGLKGRLQRVSDIKIKTAKRGITLGMNLFGGEVEEEVEEISGKKVIGTVEKVKVIGKNEKEAEVEARIDTGAGISAIDKNLAKDLGFEEAIRYWEELGLDRIMSEDEVRQLSANETWRELQIHPDVADVAKIFSAHGASYRIEVKLNLIIDDLPIISKISIANRKGLKHPLLIGRRDLKKFLIDSSKTI
ncbi:MAG TPA: sugar-transfer associated ATP-grasp domain-containing protein [Patescibacteria group bacterium]|nr:sugar-transfer associated ATP-grasp domain-containing protein [Patescibacteria group bacterium]